MCWRLRNAKETQALTEELSAIYPVKTLHQIYEEAIGEPHPFLYVNLVAKEKDDMFFVRLEHKLIVD